MKILIAFGTRPEAIKMCPVINELKKRKSIETIVCLTGQHEEMLNQVVEMFDIEVKYNLHIMKKNQTLSMITADVLTGMDKILDLEKPDLVLVHGDTSSSFSAALAAFYKHIPIGHVEAGLRTYNMLSPYPEEFNRQAVDLISDLFFAPTQLAKIRLENERKNLSRIYVTGNTVIDALKTTVVEDYHNPVLDACGDDKIILLTAHRRENIGSPMENIFNAVCDIVNRHNDVSIIYPMHKNPKVREIAKKIFNHNEKVKIIEPLDVYDFHNFLNKSYLILTDSGGIQEEAPALGKPVLVLRDTTERPEGVEAGTLKLVGTNRENIYKETEILLSNKSEYVKMSRAVNPYGDGKASTRIADIIQMYYEEQKTCQKFQ
ncbi:MAG: UDP-N-acetylglucosamine 2-epimerase (non-hydrolyzing) [Clostridium sp.]|nr:UDP-N-acetylglucosamine 2-epimerase (non-hydrolyzing) [Clostridium sp.]